MCILKGVNPQHMSNWCYIILSDIECIIALIIILYLKDDH